MALTSMFETLCLLYPADFRDLFYPEMKHTFESAAAERRQRGAMALAGFALTEFAALVLGASSEWCARAATGRSVHERCLSVSALAGDDVANAEKEIAVIIQRMVHAIANHDFPAARAYSVEERVAREKLRMLRQGGDSRGLQL